MSELRIGARVVLLENSYQGYAGDTFSLGKRGTVINFNEVTGSAYILPDGTGVLPEHAREHDDAPYFFSHEFALLGWG